MAPDPMPEPEGPEDERFVYVVTAAGVEAVREGAVVVDIERRERRADVAPPRAQGGSSRAHLGRCSPPGANGVAILEASGTFGGAPFTCQASVDWSPA